MANRMVRELFTSKISQYTRGFLPKASPATKAPWKLEKEPNGLETILMAKERIS